MRNLQLPIWFLVGVAFSCSPTSQTLLESSQNRTPGSDGGNGEGFTPNTNNYGNTTTSNTQLRLGDRKLVFSVMNQIFPNSSTAILNANVLNQVSYFGGSCDPYNRASCPSTPCSDPNNKNSCPYGANYQDSHLYGAATIPSATTASEALRIRSCEEILAQDAAVNEVRTSLGASTVNAPTRNHLKSIFQLFYDGKEPPVEVLNALEKVSIEARTNTTPAAALDGWRFVIYTVCISPEWQVL
jgi:hypothetical protein